MELCMWGIQDNMNVDLIKEEISKNFGKDIKINIYGMRNKNYSYFGKINGIYPYIFTVLINGETKSFSYSDVITKEIRIKYLN